MSTSVSKIVAERNHRILAELVLKPGNDICADCKARAPRWASHNLGIFICVNCASIHRKIGTHITKVKSITLDQWTKEQVEVMKEKGNVKSNALYNPNEARHPPPTNMVDSERDSELEKFIRSKYEFKRFIDRKSSSTSRQPVANSWATSTAPRLRSTPLTDPAEIERNTSPGPPPPPKTPENMPPRLHLLATIPSLPRGVPPPTRSASQPLPPLTNSDKLTAVPPLGQVAATQSSIQKPARQAWEDLISLQGPSQSSSLPLQYSPIDATTSFPSQLQIPVQQQPATTGGTPNPFMNLSLGQVNATTPLVPSPISVPTPGSHFPFVSSTPLSSPALHLGAMNPFNQVLSSQAVSVNGTAFSTSSNPFSSSPIPVSMAISTPTTPSAQPAMTLGTGAPLQTPPLLDVPSQTFTPTTALSFPPTPFAAAVAPATTGLVHNLFAPAGALGQIPPSASGTTNPFSAMQMGQAVFSAGTPQTAFGTTAFLSQQQAQQLHSQQQQQQQQLGPVHGFGTWAGQGVQGTF